MRIDGWIFMILSWVIILGFFSFALIKVLRKKD